MDKKVTSRACKSIFTVRASIIIRARAIVSRRTFHLFHLIWDLITMLLGDAFTSFLRDIATFLSWRWNTTQLKRLLISIIAYSFRYRTAFLMVDVFLHLLWLRSFFKFAYFLVFVMTILPFNWNWNHFG